MLLRSASAMGSIGRYQLEAALQSAHVYRCRTGNANWSDVVRLYDVLFALIGSPVVAINRALSIAELHGPEAALHAMPDLAVDPRLAEYQPYWAASAELLARSGSNEKSRRARIRNGYRPGTRRCCPQIFAAPPVRAERSRESLTDSCEEIRGYNNRFS